MTRPNCAAPGLLQDSSPGERTLGARGRGGSPRSLRGLGSESARVGGGRGRRAGGAGRSWGRSVRSERPVRRAGSRRAWGARGAVPGVELLTVGERSHVVVAHEVTASCGARALVRHEALFDLQLRVGAQAQAGDGRCLPGHPEQQQEQRRRWGPPAPGPERHPGQ